MGGGWLTRMSSRGAVDSRLSMTVRQFSGKSEINLIPHVNYSKGKIKGRGSWVVYTNLPKRENQLILCIVSTLRNRKHSD